jgi:hypothetical protein
MDFRPTAADTGENVCGSSVMLNRFRNSANSLLFAGLLVIHGPPLVLKSDNGSVFSEGPPLSKCEPSNGTDTTTM